MLELAVGGVTNPPGCPRACLTDCLSARRRYGQRYLELLKANFWRTWTLQKHHLSFTFIRTFQLGLMAFGEQARYLSYAPCWTELVSVSCSALLPRLTPCPCFCPAPPAPIACATVFWREGKRNVDDGNLFMSVIWYSVLYMMMGESVTHAFNVCGHLHGLCATCCW